MSRYRSCGVDRHAAERLLAGVPASTDASSPLAAVLRAASAPTHPAELAGEQAALVAFLDAAALDPAPVSRRPSLFRTALTKILTVKALIIVAASGSTGVVLAAVGVALPGPWIDTPADLPSVQSSTPETGSATAPPSGQKSGPASVSPTGLSSDARRPTGAGSDPAPSMTGLCRAYAAQSGVSPGKALDNPAFGAHVTAAGGVENVPAYCSDVTADQPHGIPSDQPPRTRPGKARHPSDSPPPGRTHAPVNPVPGAAHAAHPSGARPTQGG
jgi:hypothetical protein